MTSNCTSCPNGFYFYEYQCLDACPDYYYADSRSETCESCIEPCLLCLTDIKCLSCVATYYLL